MEEGGTRFPLRASSDSFPLLLPRRPREGVPGFSSGGGKNRNSWSGPPSGVELSPGTFPVVDARTRSSPPRIATCAKAEMPCAEPYRVDVSTLENGAGAPFAECNLVCGRDRARRIFSETRRNQEEDCSEFPEEDCGIKKGMTDLLLRGGGRANFPPAPLCLQVRTRICAFGCLQPEISARRVTSKDLTSRCRNDIILMCEPL